ncbi:MAG: cytochrome c [Xanthobacteraceae bacterium]|nr:cytochrome c [Xanthobacteraceae bacterium]
MKTIRNAMGCLLLGAALLTGAAVRANDSEQVRLGGMLYKEHCAKCHGENGKSGPGYPHPMWGDGAQIRKFKHAQGLIEYNRLLMPFDNPGILTDEQILAVTAFVLANHGTLAQGQNLDAGNAAKVMIER